MSVAVWPSLSCRWQAKHDHKGFTRKGTDKPRGCISKFYSKLGRRSGYCSRTKNKEFLKMGAGKIGQDFKFTFCLRVAYFTSSSFSSSSNSKSNSYTTNRCTFSCPIEELLICPSGFPVRGTI